MDEVRSLTHIFSISYSVVTLVWNWAWGEIAWEKVTVFWPGLNKNLNILCYDPTQAQNVQEARSLLLLLLLQVEESHIGSTNSQGRSIAAVHQPEWTQRGPSFPSDSLERFWDTIYRCTMPWGHWLKEYTFWQEALG